jgi:hypothetical protein
MATGDLQRNRIIKSEQGVNIFFFAETFYFYFRFVSFRFRVISFQRNIVTFRFVNLKFIFRFVSFQKIMRFLRFVPFRFVSFLNPVIYKNTKITIVKFLEPISVVQIFKPI